MREYTVEQTSLTYRWTFDKMLPSLPGPGDPEFAILCRGLRDYGISPSGISFSEETGRLADVTFDISLLDDRVTLRLSYGWVELFVSNLYEGDETALVKIAEAVFKALLEVDKSANQGRARIGYLAHLSFSPLDTEAFLREHLRGGETVPDLIADAFAYKLKWSGTADVQEPRVVVAKSLLFPSALYVEFSVEYGTPDKPAQTAERVRQDSQRVLTLLGLTPRAVVEGEDATG